MSKKLERKFTKPTQISKHLSCVICLNIFTEPTRLSCGHTFCKSCIIQWISSSSTCPQCRQIIEPEYMSKDLIPEKIIDDLEVACVHNMCEWKDRLELLEKHVKNCKIDRELPAWIKEDKNFINIDEDSQPHDQNEHLIERMNQEVPKLNLTQRMFMKSDAASRSLMSRLLNGRASTEKKNSKRTQSYDFVASLGCIDDDDKDNEEAKEDEENKENPVIEDETSNSSYKDKSVMFIDSKDDTNETLRNKSSVSTINLGIISISEDLKESSDESSTARNALETLEANSENSLQQAEEAIMEPVATGKKKVGRKRKERNGQQLPKQPHTLKKAKTTEVVV